MISDEEWARVTEYSDGAQVNDMTKKQKPTTMRFLGFLVIVGASYLIGVYHVQILTAVAPVFGMRPPAGQLDLSAVQSTYAALKENFDGDLDEQKLIDGASRGLVAAAGDRYTMFMTEKESREFDDDLSGKIGGGIGAELGLRNDSVTIVRVLDDNPAKKAGLLAGDVVTRINDESTQGWTVEKAVQRIRGEEGTTLKLAVIRGQEQKEFTLTRAIVSNPSVVAEIKESVGVMTILRFDQDTASLARVAAQKFKEADVKGVILDVRDNGGGYLTAAVDVASIWLSDKVVVTERSGDRVKDTLRSEKSPILEGVPTIVLVNGNSASASEIVAGALQDNGAATLLGTKTFGKGSVQTLLPLPEGAQLKVTIAKWYTPKGKNINEEGIMPAKIVERSVGDVNEGRDPQLDAAIAQL